MDTLAAIIGVTMISLGVGIIAEYFVTKNICKTFAINIPVEVELNPKYMQTDVEKEIFEVTANSGSQIYLTRTERNKLVVVSKNKEEQVTDKQWVVYENERKVEGWIKYIRKGFIKVKKKRKLKNFLMELFEELN